MPSSLRPGPVPLQSRVWKRDLGLLCGTKDASRALAASVFEGQAGLLK